MNITKDCVECIIGQIDKALVHLKLDEALTKSIQKEVLLKSKSFSFEHTPPYVAREVYEYLALQSNCRDPLERLKQESIEQALVHVPFIEKKYAKKRTNFLRRLKLQ